MNLLAGIVAILSEHGYGGLHQFELRVFCKCMAEFATVEEMERHVAERLVVFVEAATFGEAPIVELDPI